MGQRLFHPMPAIRQTVKKPGYQAGNLGLLTGLRALRLDVNRLIATGLVLFLLSFGVNMLARRVANSGFSGAAG